MLIIKLSSLDATSLEYVRISKKSAATEWVSGDWSIVKQQAQRQKIVLVIPTEDVLLSEVSIPGRNKKHLQQAVPYALEDNLAEDIEQLHFAIHRPTNSEITYVATINRQRLSAWLTVLHEQDLYPMAVLPDVLLLPLHDEAWTIAAHQNRVLMRQATYSGYASIDTLLPLLLENTLADEDEEKRPQQLMLHNVSASLWQALPESLPRYELKDMGHIQQQDIEAVLPLNLLRGFQQAGGAFSLSSLKAWIAPAVLLLLVLAVYLGNIAFNNYRLEAQYLALQEQAKNIYRQTFPGAQNVPNPRFMMEQKLSELNAGEGQGEGAMLPLLAKSTPHLLQHKHINIDGVQYENKRLSIKVRTNKLEDLDKLKNTLAEKTGLNMTLAAPSNTSKGATARLQIEP